MHNTLPIKIKDRYLPTSSKANQILRFIINKQGQKFGNKWKEKLMHLYVGQVIFNLPNTII